MNDGGEEWGPDVQDVHDGLGVCQMTVEMRRVGQNVDAPSRA